MGKFSSSTPKAPDPYKTASAEASINRLNTYAPGGGGTRYGYTDASGNFVEGVAPKGTQSAVSYQENDFERQMREALQPASVDMVNQVIGDNTGANMPGPARVQDRSDVAQDMFDRNYSLMADDFERENSRLMSNLQARGIPVGSEAFNDAYGQQQDSVNDAISRLTMDANLAAGQEQSRQFGLDSSERSGSINEMIAALGGGYNANSNAPSGNASGINYSGMVNNQYNADMQAAQQKNQNNMNTMGTIASIGSGLAKMSDRRLKTDVVLIDPTGELPVYQYRYLWDEPGTVRVGPMAQDILRVVPDAVKRLGRWLIVDYAKLGGRYA